MRSSDTLLVKYLRELMAKHKIIKKSQLAAKLGVSHTTAGRWLEGELVPSPHNIQVIADSFKLDADYLRALAGHRPEIQGDPITMLRPELRSLVSTMATLEEVDQETIAKTLKPIIVYMQGVKQREHRLMLEAALHQPSRATEEQGREQDK